MWMMMKVNGDLEGFKSGVHGCCVVEFCFVCHCGRLLKAMCY